MIGQQLLHSLGAEYRRETLAVHGSRVALGEPRHGSPRVHKDFQAWASRISRVSAWPSSCAAGARRLPCGPEQVLSLGYLSPTVYEQQLPAAKTVAA